MKFSTLTEVNTARDMVDTFLGYNHNSVIGQGEFYDMKNMSSDEFPVLSPRKLRGRYAYPSSTITRHTTAMIAKDALCFIDNNQLYINNYKVTELSLNPLYADKKRKLVSMGAYLLIFPDKKYINTVNYTDCGDIEASAKTQGTVSFQLCKVDGETYDDAITSDTQPSDPKNGDLWIDTSSTPHTLKQYSSSSAVWVSIATTYVKISNSAIDSQFAEYDAVTINGIDSSFEYLKDYNGQSVVLYGAGDGYVIISGIIDRVGTQTAQISFDRLMPNMDFITESENRLWGCRYGINANNEPVNEIYACKLGDFKNWSCYMGLSTDSYAATVGTDGAFTGAITHLGYPLFFKENCLHKVYGNFPSNYQIQTTVCRGVQEGAGDSLAIVNEILYYKSRNGICAYDGSLPTEISSAFGDIHYSAVDKTDDDFLHNGAVAGSYRSKYYVSMKSEVDEEWHLFVYDAEKQLWHKEDNLRVDGFCTCRNELYYIDHADGFIKSITNGDGAGEAPIDWMVESGILTTNMPDKKYISRVVIRMALGIGSEVKISIQYDSMGEYTEIASMTGTTLRSFALPVRPKRCDHFRLKLTGTGEAKIFSITKTIEQGSDM